MRLGEQTNDGTERITTRAINFAGPFTLGRSAEVYPAGIYEVETIEQAWVAAGHTAHVRKSTSLIIRTATGIRCREVLGSDLDEALRRASPQQLSEPSENPDREEAEAS